MDRREFLRTQLKERLDAMVEKEIKALDGLAGEKLLCYAGRAQEFKDVVDRIKEQADKYYTNVSQLGNLLELPDLEERIKAEAWKADRYGRYAAEDTADRFLVGIKPPLGLEDLVAKARAIIEERNAENRARDDMLMACSYKLLDAMGNRAYLGLGTDEDDRLSWQEAIGLMLKSPEELADIVEDVAAHMADEDPEKAMPVWEAEDMAWGTIAVEAKGLEGALSVEDAERLEDVLDGMPEQFKEIARDCLEEASRENRSPSLG